MGFDGAAFIERFNTVWNGHDVDGILAMMTDDVVFEASFGKEIVGDAGAWASPPSASSSTACSRGSPTYAGTRSGTTSIRTWPWWSGSPSGTPHGGTRFEVYGCDVLALRDGRIAAKRSFRKGVI